MTTTYDAGCATDVGAEQDDYSFHHDEVVGICFDSHVVSEFNLNILFLFFSLSSSAMGRGNNRTTDAEATKAILQKKEWVKEQVQERFALAGTFMNNHYVWRQIAEAFGIQGVGPSTMKEVYNNSKELPANRRGCCYLDYAL